MVAHGGVGGEGPWCPMVAHGGLGEETNKLVSIKTRCGPGVMEHLHQALDRLTLLGKPANPLGGLKL